MPKTPTSDLVLTAEAATIIGVDVRTIHRWVRSGKLKAAADRPADASRRSPYVFHRADITKARNEWVDELLAKAGIDTTAVAS